MYPPCFGTETLNTSLMPHLFKGCQIRLHGAVPGSRDMERVVCSKDATQILTLSSRTTLISMEESGSI